jgi:hypothetical protein
MRIEWQGGVDRRGFVPIEQAAAPKLTGSRPGAAAAVHRANEGNRQEESVSESEWG